MIMELKINPPFEHDFRKEFIDLINGIHYKCRVDWDWSIRDTPGRLTFTNKYAVPISGHENEVACYIGGVYYASGWGEMHDFEKDFLINSGFKVERLEADEQRLCPYYLITIPS